MPDLLDHPTAVRPGEELDLARLEPFLLGRFPGSTGPLAVEQFPSGHSNLTYLVRLGDREMVLRRPPFGSKVKTAHDMGREYRVLSKLHAFYPAAPKVLLYCGDDSILGSPFYLVSRVTGHVRFARLPGLIPDCRRKTSGNALERLRYWVTGSIPTTPTNPIE